MAAAVRWLMKAPSGWISRAPSPRISGVTTTSRSMRTPLKRRRKRFPRNSRGGMPRAFASERRKGPWCRVSCAVRCQPYEKSTCSPHLTTANMSPVEHQGARGACGGGLARGETRTAPLLAKYGAGPLEHCNWPAKARFGAALLRPARPNLRAGTGPSRRTRASGSPRPGPRRTPPGRASVPAIASTSSRWEAWASCQPVIRPFTTTAGWAGVTTRSVQPQVSRTTSVDDG